MFWKKIIAIIVSVLLLLVSACNLPVGPAAVGGTNPEPTVPIETQVAGIVASTEAAQTALANAVASTMAAMSTNTPELTFTPSLTPTLTFTFTPNVPLVSVSSNTYCRSGPGAPYDILGTLNVGETAEVIGRNVVGDTWIIKLPSNPAITCWLWGYYATVVGNTSGLTVYTPPPTPTPVPAFTFSYHFWGVGPGYQCLLFEVTNTGQSSWESYTLAVHDITHGDTGLKSSDDFTGYDTWCGPTETLLDLTPGESGTASVKTYMVHDASGDHFDATLTLCSGNGQTGSCLTKSINFIF
jgi:hypothetical protein